MFEIISEWSTERHRKVAKMVNTERETGKKLKRQRFLYRVFFEKGKNWPRLTFEKQEIAFLIDTLDQIFKQVAVVSVRSRVRTSLGAAGHVSFLMVFWFVLFSIVCMFWKQKENRVLPARIELATLGLWHPRAANCATPDHPQGVGPKYPKIGQNPPKMH